jgi:hypothetical protein
MRHDPQQRRNDQQKKSRAKSFMQSLEGKTRSEIVSDFQKKDQEKLSVDAISRSTIFGIKGVYFLFRDRKLLYIGESECVTTRIGQHIQDGVKNFDSYKIIPVETSTADRKRLEKKLIKRHSPPLNVAHNKAVNFYSLPT